MKTHCVHGHEYTLENTCYNKTNGQRFCRICHNIRSSSEKNRQSTKRYHSKRKAAGWTRDYKSEAGYPKVIERATAWNSANKERRRNQPCNRPEALRLQRYGLTPEKYKEMYDAQGGRCALKCGRPIECVDHNHVTETVRELLCRKCNSALGMLDDDPLLVIRAAEYLRMHK